MADGDKHVLELMDEDTDAYRDADMHLPRCEPEGDDDEDPAANLIVLWDGHPTRVGLVTSDEKKTYLLAARKAAKSWAQYRAFTDGLPTESVAETYHRLTGKNFADLPPYVREGFRFLPPDADMSDIEFVLDPPPHAAEGGAPRIYGPRKRTPPKG